MDKARRAIRDAFIWALAVGVIGYTVGYVWGDWAERSLFVGALLVSVWMCLNYQAWLELNIGEEQLEQLHQRHKDSLD